MIESIKFVLISVTVLLLLAKTARGCGGYKLEIEYIKNCNSDNVIELSDNFNVAMTDDCELLFTGCITAHANITSVEIEYTVQKDMIKGSGKKDGCNQLENKTNDIELGLEILGFPKRCPINEGTVCVDNKSINVSKYKLRMNLIAGHLKGKALITTNTGKSCMEYSVKLINAVIKALPSIGIMG